MNALLFAKQSVENSIVYVTHHPCDNCLKHLLQAGITEICYKDNSLVDRFTEYQIKAINLLIESTGIIVRQYEQ
jgi:dCMP deaminase